MMKYSLLLLLFLGCASDPVSTPAPIPKPAPTHTPVPPSAKSPSYYQGYAVSSQFNTVTHTFQRAAGDSVTAQIRVVEADDEIHATVSITNGDKPFEVFLFLHNGYYIGSDSISYAYFSGDYNTIVWGQRSADSGNLYQTIYASR